MLTKIEQRDGYVLLRLETPKDTHYLVFKEEEVGDATKATKFSDIGEARQWMPTYKQIDRIGNAIIFKATTGYNGCIVRYTVALAGTPPHKGRTAYALRQARELAALVNHQSETAAA